MLRTHKEHKDFFWAGFLTGMIAGGTLGILLGSEVGRKTCQRIEVAAREVRSRMNGTTPPEEAAEMPEPPPEENMHDAT